MAAKLNTSSGTVKYKRLTVKESHDNIELYTSL